MRVCVLCVIHCMMLHGCFFLRCCVFACSCAVESVCVFVCELLCVVACFRLIHGVLLYALVCL